MLVASLLALSLSAAPDAGVAPSPREMVQLFFLAGDLRRAIDAGHRCIELEGRKKCEGLYRALVEYQALVPKNETLTRAEAKQYLAWDHAISPQAEGRLTTPVRKRYVLEPLDAARRAVEQGESDKAKALLGAVREVDPSNEDAAKLEAALSTPAR